MKHEINQDRTQLKITVTPDEQTGLRAMTEIHSDKAMVEFLEPLTSNSELEWVFPAYTGDLTDAPMLGIYGEERPFHKEDETITHAVTGPNLIQEIEERWAFMEYQVRSVLEDLRDKGECVFVSE